MQWHSDSLLRWAVFAHGILLLDCASFCPVHDELNGKWHEHNLIFISLFSGIMRPGLNAILGPTGSGKSSWVPIWLLHILIRYQCQMDSGFAFGLSLLTFSSSNAESIRWPLMKHCYHPQMEFSSLALSVFWMYSQPGRILQVFLVKFSSMEPYSHLISNVFLVMLSRYNAWSLYWDVRS